MNEKFLPKFNKNTIETGMVLETEKGELFLVSEVNNELILINNENCKKLYDYNFYLQYFNHWDSVHNIIKAYKAKDYNKNNLNELLNKDNLNLIWYEDYKPKMTKKDIEQELGYQIEIVEEKEKDSSNYNYKPSWMENCTTHDGGLNDM